MPHSDSLTAVNTDAPAWNDPIKGSIDEDDYAIVPGVVGEAKLASLTAETTAALASEEVMRGKGVYGVRNLFNMVPGVRALAASPAMRGLVEPVLGAECFAVRAIFFDKVEGANWKVPWHQDVSVAAGYYSNLTQTFQG